MKYVHAASMDSNLLYSEQCNKFRQISTVTFTANANTKEMDSQDKTKYIKNIT